MWDPQLSSYRDGYFFICTHGVKVEAAADTVVAWTPTSWHGTSLQQHDFNNPIIFQAGLSIFTPPGVCRLWGEVLEKKSL